MSHFRLQPYLLLFFLCLCGSEVSAQSTQRPLTRTWTSADGREVQGQLIAFDGTTVTLNIRGRSFPMPVAKLSEADQDFLATWRKEQVEKNRRSTGNISDLKLSQKHADSVSGYIYSDHHRDFMAYLKKRWPKKDFSDAALKRYTLHNEFSPTAKAYVPQNYNEDPDRRYGIYVHIHSDNSPRLPNYQDSFDKHHIIGISPAKAGNSENEFQRMALALDCVATLRSTYRIDPERIYVGGLSGGGADALFSQLMYPKSFNAAISHVRGLNLEDRDGDKPGRYWPSEVDFLSKNELKALAKQGHKWAFVSGPKDFNYKHIKEGFPIWQKYGFDVEFFDVPNMGHKVARPEEFEKILQWLER